MGYLLNTSAGSLPEVLRLTGPDADAGLVALARKRVEAEDARRAAFGDDDPYGVTTARALEDLLAGITVDADESGAYARAFLALTGLHFRRGPDIGPFPRPAAFLETVDAELARLGVPSRLLPTGIVWSGPPRGVDLPWAEWPVLGWLPLEDARAVVDAYDAVIDAVDPDLRGIVRELGGVAGFGLDAAAEAAAAGRPAVTGVLTRLG